MKYVIHLIFFWITLQGLQAECSEGTLICDLLSGTTRSLLCDYTNNYERDEDWKCVKKSIEGCERKLFDSNTGCLLCEPGKVLDAQSKTCVLIASDLAQPNCQRYGAFNSTCIECQSGFYLEHLSCRPVVKKVAHCARHDSANTCGQCDSGFMLEDSQCVFFEKVHGCRQHRDLACDTCQAGFSLAQFKPIQITLDDDFKSRLFKEELSTQLWTGDHHIEFCLKHDGENCQEFEAHDKCKTCSSGFYMNTEGQCLINPLPKLERCLVYSDVLTCARCEHGYYLAGNPISCVAVSKVENCDKYMAVLNRCEKCAEKFYLNSSTNKCVERAIHLFTHCKSLSPTVDGCSGCQENYALTLDQLACLPTIPNCFELEFAATKDVEAHACKSCGYRKAFVNRACIAGPDANCLWYEEDQCIECTQYYYIKGKGCEKRMVENCIEVMGLDSDECKTCSTGFSKTGSNQCVTQNQPNCFKHVSSANECEECEVGYYLDNIECKRQNIPNCSNYLSQQNVCMGCSVGFYLDSGTKQCTKQYIPDCLAYTSNTNTCTQCISHYILNTGSNSCDLPTLSNCIIFKANTNECESNGCQKGYYFDQNVCKPHSQPQCIKYTTGTNTCTKCQAGYYLDVGDNNTCKQQNVTHCVDYTYDSPNCVACALGYELADALNCIQKVRSQCISYNDTTLACTKCQIGYYLDGGSGNCTVQQVTNCIEYTVDSENCSRCSDGYVLDSSGNKCDAFTGANCIAWNSSSGDCTACAAHYTLLGNNTCQKMNISGCIEYTADGKCEKCQAGKFKNVGKTACNLQSTTKCVEFDGKSNDCVVCEVGYYENSKSCSIQSITGCIKYKANKNECETCASTHVLASATSCVSFALSNCAEHSASGLCSECGPNQYLSGTTCTNRDVANCINYTGNTNTCETCAEGTQLKPGKTCENYSQTNCIEFNTSTHACSKCKAGSFLKDSVCVTPSVTSCITYQVNSTDCITCKAGTYLKDASTCDPWDITGCIKFTLNKNECEACEPGYTLSGTTCNLDTVIVGCLTRDGAGDCNLCAQGFFLSVTKQCIQLNYSKCIEYNDDSCTYCELGYYLNASGNSGKGECLAWNNPGCITITPNTNDCSKCALGYIATGTTCAVQTKANCIKFANNTSHECEMCAVNYYMSGGNCLRQDIDDCVDYVPNSNSCVTCKDGYITNVSFTCEPITPIPNCLVPTSTNTCTQCRFGYFNSTPQVCFVMAKDNCLSVDVDNNKCLECEYPYILADSGACNSPTPVTGCLEYTDEDKCADCAVHYFTDPSTGCVAINHWDNCKTYSIVYACTECMAGYKFNSDRDQCIAEIIPFCKTRSGEDCLTCPDYYFLDGTSCTATGNFCKNIKDGSCTACHWSQKVSGSSCDPIDTHCLEYLEGIVSAKCKTCESLFKPNAATKICEAISNEGCGSSNGLDDACLTCKINKFGAACDKDRVKTADRYCLLNATDNEKSACTQCKSTYIKFKGNYKVADESKLTANCDRSVDNVTGKCNRCKKGFQISKTEVEGVITVTCTETEITYWMACNHVDAGYDKTFLDNENCLACTDYRRFYYDSSQKKCLSRQQSQNMVNCAVWDSSSKNCLECTEKSFYEASTGFEQCMPVADLAISPINHCIAYVDNATCGHCVSGKKPNTAGDACEDINIDTDAFVTRAYGRNFDFYDPAYDSAQLVTNCEAYSQVFEATIGCTKCKAGFVGIVANPLKAGVKNYAYSVAANNIFGVDDVITVFISCLPEADTYLLSANEADKPVGHTNCLVGMQMANDDKGGYACIRCKDGFIGKIGQLTHYPDLVAIPGNYKEALIECTAKSSDMTKTHGGMFFNNSNNLGYELTPSSYFGYDTCPGGKSLVYFLISRMSPFTVFFPKSKNSSGDPFHSALCLQDSKLDLVDGCQFYALSGDFTTNPDLSTGDKLTNVHCIMCKPHYEAKDGTCIDQTAKCTAHADPSKEFLGGCRVSSRQRIYNYHDGQIFTQATAADTPVEKCIVLNDDLRSECMMPEEKYEFRNYNVDKSSAPKQGCKVRIGVSSGVNPESTEKIKIAETLTITGLWNVPEKRMRTFNKLIFLRYDTEDTDYQINNPKGGCVECNTGYVLNLNTTGSVQTCSPTATDPGREDCIRYNALGGTHCKACKNSKKATSTGVCFFDEKEHYQYCLTPIISTFKCAKCAPGTGVSNSHQPDCRHAQCERNAAGKCVFCNNGFTVASSGTICKEEIGENDNCYKYNGIGGTCVSCGSNAIPSFRYTRDSASDSFTVVDNPENQRCVPFSYDFSRYRGQMYFHAKFYYTKDTGEMTTDIQFIEATRYSDLSYADGETEADLTDLHCIGNHTIIENCETAKGFFCEQCSPGFISKDGYTCEAGAISDCKTAFWSLANNKEECTACLSTHYLANATTCTARSKSTVDKCFESKPDSDDCTWCGLNYYQTGTTCTQNTAINCLTKSRTANECTECVADYSFDAQAPRVCVVLSSAGGFEACTILAADNLSCTECQIGHYLKDGNCGKNSSTDCSDYSSSENECTACAPNKKLKGNKTGCEAKTATKCKTFSTTEDKCATCAAPFVLEGNNCVAKTATNCLTYSNSQAVADKAKCGSCGRLDFLGGDGICTPKSTSNCLTYDSTEDTCASCGNSFTFSANSCTRKPDMNCRIWKISTDPADSTKCGGCSSDYIPNTTDETCTKIVTPSELCDGYTAGTSTCDTCSPTMKWSTDKCALMEATGCKTFSPTTNDQCLSCGANFYADTTNCSANSSEHCLTWDAATGLCDTCQSGFIKSSGGACEHNNATKCKTKKTNEHKCNDCEDQFKLDSSSTNCELKTAAFCPDFSTSLDKCTGACGNGFYSDNTNCVSRTATNCKTFDNSLDQCATCSDWFYKDGSNSCIRRNPNHCLTFVATDNDHCATCKPDMVLVANVCAKNTETNCKTFLNNTNGCASCGAKYYLSGTQCLAKNASNCVSFKPGTGSGDNGCASCEAEFWTKSGDTCSVKTTTRCKTYNATVDQCATCGANFKLNESTFDCEARTAVLCDEYTTMVSDDQCNACTNGFNMNGSNCQENDKTLCKTFKDGSNECQTCDTTMFVLGAGSCTKKSKTMCKTLKTNADECLDCSDMMQLNGASDSCEDKTAQFCKGLSTTEDKCTSCGDYFYLGSKDCERDQTQHCLDYNGTEQGCTQCGKEYLLSNSKTCDKLTKPGCLTLIDRQNKCQSCVHDHILGVDGSCTPNSNVNCKTFNNNAEGCATCDDLFVKTSNNKDCEWATAINCQDLLKGQNKCNNCFSTYIKDTADNNICKPNTGANCSVFSTALNQCQACSPGFYSDGPTCKLVTAQGCKTWVSQQNTCNECLDGYEKVGNNCDKEFVPNCSKYRSGEYESCEICDPLHHPVLNGHNKWNCQKNTNTSCRKYIPNTNDCDECIEGYMYYISGQNIECRPYTIENCKSYLPRNNLCETCNDDSFREDINNIHFMCKKRQHTNCKEFKNKEDSCVSCHPGMYLSPDDLCISPTAITNCLVYSQTKNECSQCDLGFFLDKSKNECLANPKGAIGCVEYHSNLECLKCDSTRYLHPETQECVRIIKIVDHCIQYSDAVSCGGCEPGFKPFNTELGSECLIPTIANCAKHKATNQCYECEPAFVLNSDTLRCDDSGISNCSHAEKTDDKVQCLSCKPNYSLASDKSSCTKINLNVPNCLEHGLFNFKPICVRCLDRFVRSKDGQACLPMAGFNLTNCLHGFQNSTNRCQLCHPGYELNKDFKCQVIKLKNCALVDLANNTCSLCLPGTHMNDKKECVGTPDVEVKDPTVGSGDTGDGNGNGNGDGGSRGNSISIIGYWNMTSSYFGILILAMVVMNLS